MTYEETTKYLYSQLPMYQRVGKQAFKKDLGNITALCEYLGQPHLGFKSVHIAGTNGKGSTAHILSAILQTAGYKVGLYSSPHYKDYRERIKINGEFISKEAVVDFVANNKTYFEEIRPSFFEMTVAMAFDHFRNEKVDIAIIETGLGGRLDSTNIITPLLSIITNIGMDHEAMLGNTLPLIAAEKAGIIKPNTPVHIGEGHPETEKIFREKARKEEAPLTFVDDMLSIELVEESNSKAVYNINFWNETNYNLEGLALDLTGNYQIHNLKTAVLAAHFLMTKLFFIKTEHFYTACANVQGISKMVGRWQVINKTPLTICDSAHNEDGIRYVVKALQQLNKRIHFVYGTVKDKDLDKIFPLLPKYAQYYFCKANVPRGLDAKELEIAAQKHHLTGASYDSVNTAFEAAKNEANPDDCIFIGGSIFVVAEVI